MGYEAEVAEQAEAGDVGAGVDADAHHRLGCGAVEFAHNLDGAVEGGVVCALLLAGGGDDACADGLGEDEGVAGAGAGVGDLAAGLDDAGDRQAVFGLFVVDGVAAYD